MNKKRTGAVFVALLVCGLASQASAQGPEAKFNSNADDLTQIRGVLDEFRQDIIRKDGYAITKLVLNPNVLFHHTNTQEEVDSARKSNAQFDGIGPSQLDGFAKIPRYVEGQTRREISEHRDSPGWSSRAGGIQLRFCHQRQGSPFRPRSLAGVQN